MTPVAIFGAEESVGISRNCLRPGEDDACALDPLHRGDVVQFHHSSYPSTAETECQEIPTKRYTQTSRYCTLPRPQNKGGGATKQTARDRAVSGMAQSTQAKVVVNANNNRELGGVGGA